MNKWLKVALALLVFVVFPATILFAHEPGKSWVGPGMNLIVYFGMVALGQWSSKKAADYMILLGDAREEGATAIAKMEALRGEIERRLAEARAAEARARATMGLPPLDETQLLGERGELGADVLRASASKKAN
jgi:hypothetical protein